jgi:outer membrane biosynthesis protein TonB
MRALALTLVISVSGCAFAVKHPPATAAILGGSIGLVTCEVGTDFEEHAACGIVTAGAAAVLGLVTWAAIALGGPGDTVLQGGDGTEQEAPVPQDPTLDQPPAESPVTPTPAPTPTPTPDPTPAPSTDPNAPPPPTP